MLGKTFNKFEKNITYLMQKCMYICEYICEKDTTMLNLEITDSKILRLPTQTHNSDLAPIKILLQIN